MACRVRAILGAWLAIAALYGSLAHADEGGVSFWLPGQFGSFAAVAPDPGWALSTFYYNYGGAAGAERVLRRGRELTTGLNGSFNALFLVPSYTPNVTILGARPSFSLMLAPGYASTSADVAVGRLSRSVSDSVFGVTDLYPTVQLFWNFGAHNLMTYLTGGIPVGSYNPNRLSNLGIGHGAIDGGGAYTYLNAKSGTEFSATLGLTGNFTNPSTNYTNGTDLHLDLGAGQFLTQKFFIGAVGYYYQQLTADNGQRPLLGPNESRTRGVGPQLGYFLDIGGRTVYANLRGYIEFGSYRRTQGHTFLATLSIPLWGETKADVP